MHVRCGREAAIDFTATEILTLPHNVRDQRRRAVGAPLAGESPWESLAVPASGVTKSAAAASHS